MEKSTTFKYPEIKMTDWLPISDEDENMLENSESDGSNDENQLKKIKLSPNERDEEDNNDNSQMDTSGDYCSDSEPIK